MNLAVEMDHFENTSNELKIDIHVTFKCRSRLKTLSINRSKHVQRQNKDLRIYSNKRQGLKGERPYLHKMKSQTKRKKLRGVEK